MDNSHWIKNRWEPGITVSEMTKRCQQYEYDIETDGFVRKCST